MGIDKERIKNLCPPNSSLIIFYKKADKMIWPIHQKLLLEDATPRNLVIGKDIADDHLYTNVLGDGGGCHLHVFGELLESPPVLAAQREVDWLDLQEVVARLVLGCGEGHSSTAVDPMFGNLPNVAGDVPQTGGDGVAASVHRSGGGGRCGMEGLDLRLQD